MALNTINAIQFYKSQIFIQKQDILPLTEEKYESSSRHCPFHEVLVPLVGCLAQSYVQYGPIQGNVILRDPSLLSSTLYPNV